LTEEIAPNRTDYGLTPTKLSSSESQKHIQTCDSTSGN